MKKQKKKMNPKVKAVIIGFFAFGFFSAGISEITNDLGASFVGFVLGGVLAYWGFMTIKPKRRSGTQAHSCCADHGMIHLSVAGVTFENDDGSSRQYILEHTKRGAEVTLEPYLFKGEDAIRVLCDGLCIGNIRRSDIEEVSEIIDDISDIDLMIEPFDNDEGQIIYRAELKIHY